MNLEEIKFDGKVYQCRSIADLQHKLDNLLVAPLCLKEKLKLDENGDGEFYAVGVDEQICYYATPEEMQLSDTDLYKLIYNN